MGRARWHSNISIEPGFSHKIRKPCQDCHLDLCTDCTPDGVCLSCLDERNKSVWQKMKEYAVRHLEK